MRSRVLNFQGQSPTLKSQVASHQNSDSTRLDSNPSHNDSTPHLRVLAIDGWPASSPCAASVLMEDSPLSKKIKQKINIDTRNSRTLRGGRFGAFSTRNLFHFRFPVHKVGELTVQIQADSAPLIGYTMKRRQTGGQSLRVNSLPVR